MKDKSSVRIIERIAECAPALGRELRTVLASHRAPCEEIRLRSGGVSTVRAGGVDLPLFSSVRREELEQLLHLLCGGSLFSARDSLLRGFVSAEGGVRVGVIGDAGYDGGRCVGISGVRGLVFRIPSGECSFADTLFSEWQRAGGGLLVISPPAGGKTTVLRALAYKVGVELGLRAVIVDERLEFDPADYVGGRVDILGGYRRDEGIEIAVRTASPEVLFCDEVLTEGDHSALLLAVGAGITVVASAHGDSVEGVTSRRGMRPLIEQGAFRTAAVIRRTGTGFGFECTALGAPEAVGV